MKRQEPQRWNEPELQERAVGMEVSRVPARREPGFSLQGPVVWEASLHCERCCGLMYRIQLRDWGGSRGPDGCDALQCIACGDIIDSVIEKNRRGSEQSPMAPRKTREGRPRIALAL